MKKSPRKYTGSLPAFDDGWKPLATLTTHEGEWMVCQKRKHRSKRCDIKVLAIEEVPFKANYSLQWEDDGFWTCEDLSTMQQHREGLFRSLVDLLLKSNPHKKRKGVSLKKEDAFADAGTVTFEGAPWVMSIQAQDEWANYKVRLAAQEPVTTPATYSFLWDGVKAMARFGKIKRLEKERPALYEQAIALLQEAAPRYPEAALAQRKRAVYQGNAPDPEEGWRLETTILCPEGAPWDLYVKDGKNGEHGLLSAKLVAREGASFKANFWLGWTGEKNLKCRDAGLLAKHFPTLYDQVEEVFRGLASVAAFDNQLIPETEKNSGI